MTEERVLPHNHEAEQALLGSILLDERVLDEAIEVVKPSDFFRRAHELTYQVLLDMRNSGENIDVISARDYMRRMTVKGLTGDTTALEEIGGAYYLLELQNSCSMPGMWRQYAEIVHRDGVYRRLIKAGLTVQTLGYEAPTDIEKALSEASTAVMEVALENATESKTAAEVGKEFLAELHAAKRNFITPPNVPFVRIRPEDLVVIAAGPSVGKTATALHWADEWSKTKSVTYFEYEMTEADLMTRLICTHAGVTWEQIQDRDLSVEEIERIEDATKELAKRKLRIQEVWCPIGTLLAKIRQEAQRGAEVVVLDHLGLIPFDIPRGMNLAKAYGTQVTGRLKRLASELKITIVLLVQISREGQKDGAFPKLHHLRDSGEIEQDASIVICLWSDKSIEDNPAKKVTIREQSGVLGREELTSTEFNLIRSGVEKNRNGRLGQAWSLYHGKHFRYEERDTERHAFGSSQSALFAGEAAQSA